MSSTTGRRGVAMPGLLSLLAVLALSLFAIRAAGCSRSKGEAGLPMIRMQVGDETVSVELATTEASRARGLMYRRSMADDDGMLFIYPKPRKLSFWMKNTYLPLTIAFIDADDVIVHIEDMKPLTTNSHPAPTAVPYALEMNQGWFAEHGVKVGDTVSFTLPEGLEVTE